MKPRFRDWVTLLVFGGLVFFHFRGYDAVWGGAFQQENAMAVFNSLLEFPKDDRKLLLFVLDFDDFACISCLDSFLGMYRMLPPPFKVSNTWGVLIVKGDGEEGDRTVRIAEKKLRGFVRANRIASPILLDRSRLFAGWAEKGSGVLFFDGAKKTVRRYDFPLAGEQLEEIFATLTE